MLKYKEGKQPEFHLAYEWGVWESICKYRVWSVVRTTEPVLIESLVQHDHFKRTTMR